MRTQGESRYKIKSHFLKNVEREEHVGTLNIDKQIERVLTPCRQKEGQSQDGDGNRPGEGNSLPGDDGGWDKLEHGKKATQRGALTSWRPRWDKSGGKKPTGQEALTSWRRQREEQVKTRKKTERARVTHFLETAEAETSQDTERN